MNRALIALPLLALSLAVAGCPGKESTPVTIIPPTPTPSWAPSMAPTEGGAYSSSGIEVSGGSLFVEVKNADGAAVKGATLRLYGPTLAVVTTDASGQATLGPLATGGGYRLVVEAASYATSQVGNITINKNEVTAERPSLTRGASLGGQFLVDGKAVSGAVVSDGINSTLTDASGNYTLNGVTPGQVTLTASKPRCKTTTRELSVAAGGAKDIALASTSVAPMVYFDSTVSSGVNAGQLVTLRQSLQDAGWTISATPPASEGVWMLFSPSQVPDSDTVGRIVNFVAQGGKLVIFGEWGGYAGFHNPGANDLAHQMGLHFNPDLVRVPGTSPGSEWLTLRNFQPGLNALSDVSTIQLYSACSLFALAPMTSIAQTGSDAYRIQANGEIGVKDLVMGGPYKAGKAIALGDASGWLDESTNGAVNAKQADNLKLVSRLLDW